MGERKNIYIYGKYSTYLLLIIILYPYVVSRSVCSNSFFFFFFSHQVYIYIQCVWGKVYGASPLSMHHSHSCNVSPEIGGGPLGLV